jgi:hypothetical protein
MNGLCVPEYRRRPSQSVHRGIMPPAMNPSSAAARDPAKLHRRSAVPQVVPSAHVRRARRVAARSASVARYGGFLRRRSQTGSYCVRWTVLGLGVSSFLISPLCPERRLI